MPRVAPANAGDGRSRLAVARTYLDAARVVADTHGASAAANAAVGNAVLSGIAASDAICAVRLGQIHRGPDHGGATDLLRQATPDGKTLATTLARLLGLKDQGHYGTSLLTAANADRAIGWAQRLIDRATEELER